MAPSIVVNVGFLSSELQEIHRRLSLTRDFRNYSDEEVVKKLEITLSSINEVLADAETKQYQYSKVKNWLVLLKHEVYEFEQLLDVIDTESLQREGTIRRFVSGLKKRSEYRIMIKELLQRLELRVEQKDILRLQKATRDNHVTPIIRISGKLSKFKYDDYREHEKEEIIHFLLADTDCDKQVSIISILGPAGMGKTTLAHLVYNDRRIQEQFEIKVWVPVLESFDLIRLTRSILESIDSSAAENFGSILESIDSSAAENFGNHRTILESIDSSAAENFGNPDILQDQLEQRLTGKRYLLVLDDFWNKDGNMWEHFLLPFSRGSSQGKVIITTHDMDVALIMGSTRLLHLKRLEESNSWSLFVRHAFRGRKVVEYPHLELIGKNIVEKCRGLPFALENMGNLLQKKFSEREWVEILETDLLHLPEGGNYIKSTLRLIYFNLPSNLKRCFAYCSIFPKDYKFEKGQLIRLWMAVGLLKCCRKDKSEEELGNEFFDHLESISFIQRSIITPTWAGKYYYFMDDPVNELATQVSGKLFLEGDHVQDIPKRTRHIWCCLDLKDGDRKLEHISKIEGLHSLMVEAQGCGDQRFKISTNVQQNLFLRLKYLRMLSFSSCNLLELADEITNLKLLRYLDLSDTDIASLPNSICMLYSLQTLLLQDCFKLTELPSDFCKLTNLRHLNLEGTHIKKMPTKIGELKNLQMLTDFVVGEQHGSDINQLGKLNQLRGKLQISGLENIIDPADAVAANLEDKKHLVELSMSYDQWREIDGSVTKAHVSVLEALQPNRNLMGLTIKDYRDISFPNWLRDRHLPNLVSLELLGCKLCSKMPPLGQFPSLTKLSISGCDGIKIIDTEFYGYDSSDVPFRSLETLRFEHMSELTEWLCLEGFPLLQELCIKNCPKLKSDLPQYLPSLQKLEIIDCQELEASIPRSANISELELKRCDDIWINEFSSTLKRVILCGTQVIRSSLEKILFNNAFLVELEVGEFFGPNLEWSSLDFSSRNSLRSLTISGWHSSSLPFALHLFTNLNSLVLYDCPSLESFSGSQLPSNLSSLGIERCPELMASREEWGLFQLNSLKQFRVSDDFEIFESFPEESLLPSTINSLELTNCSNLRIINHNGLLHLTSLESLYIEDCPCLESLPEDGLPSSLSTLSIHDCPLIMQQYQKERGERWHTISHIPDVIIS